MTFVLFILLIGVILIPVSVNRFNITLFIGAGAFTLFWACVTVLYLLFG